VKTTAQKLVESKGPEILRQIAKIHFRTAHAAAPEHFTEPPPRQEWRR
jgi:ribonuclease HIII